MEELLGSSWITERKELWERWRDGNFLVRFLQSQHQDQKKENDKCHGCNRRLWLPGGPPLEASWTHSEEHQFCKSSPNHLWSRRIQFHHCYYGTANWFHMNNTYVFLLPDRIHRISNLWILNVTFKNISNILSNITFPPLYILFDLYQQKERIIITIIIIIVDSQKVIIAER